ncbi:MAG: SGNH/GDSL hydrolase family protein [Pseudodonghicola sp.]|nr:SGNH/GDSL hydrolase family protein [Pseudodonghicola sp.]
MTLYISGGSNSLLKGSWVHKLQERLPAEREITNISIGAAPSQMGAFRCLHTIDLKPGDTVIWEYGVNDANHIDSRGYTNAEQKKALEWTIRHCRDRGAKFAAMIFQPEKRERRQRVTAYRQMLHRVCTRYGVGFFDVPLAYLDKNPEEKRIPARYFRENAHYKTNTDLMQLIVDGALDLIENAKVPMGSFRNEAGALKAYSHFEGGEAEAFENRVVKATTWRPGETGLTRTLEGAGRIVGLVITSTPKGGVFDLSVGDRTIRLCASFHEKEFNKTLVKFISIPMLLGEEIAFQAGTPLTISWADTSAGMFSDYRFKKKVGQSAINQREAGIVAVLTEE